VPSTHQPRLLTWTIPTPQGLWYQAFVLVDSGLFATPRIDTTTMDGLKAAAGTDTRTVVEFLTDHGRSKRPYRFHRGCRRSKSRFDHRA
jgi:hypothetical protein